MGQFEPVWTPEIGEVISEAASALACIGLGLCPGIHLLLRSGSPLPYFPMCISFRDNLSWTGGLVPHLKFSPMLRGPKLWRAYLKARVDTLALPADSSLFCPPHLQRPWPGKTCLNLGTPARPHLELLPTCWGQTDPEIQLVSRATLVPPPTRPSAPRLEAPYGGLHFRTSQ